MKVLFATHAPPDKRTAVFSWVQERADAMKRRGHEVVIWTPADFPWIENWHPGFRLFIFALAVARGARALGRLDCAVFHSWSGWIYNLTRKRWPRGSVSVTQFHGVEPLYFQRVQAELGRGGEAFSIRHRLLQTILMPCLLRASCQRSDAVLCLNREEQQYLAVGGYAPPERVHLVRNGVDMWFFGLPRSAAGGHRITFVGQWLDAKGTATLASAFTQLARADVRLELHCLGTRTRREIVEAAFPTELRHRVRVEPDLDRDGIGAALALSDAFALPSISEGSSLALLEAMAAGCAIVATPVGAAPDMLEHGVSALFVPVGDSGALAAALDRLVADPALCSRLGAAAKAAARPYERALVEAAYVALLEGLVGPS